MESFTCRLRYDEDMVHFAPVTPAMTIPIPTPPYNTPELVSSSKLTSFPSANNHVTVLAFREGSSYRKRLEQYLGGLGVKSIKVIELGTLEGILGCVAAGLRVSLVPEKVVREARYTLAVHQVPDQYGIAPTVLVHRKDGFISSALTQFIETVRSSGHSLQTEIG